MTYYQDASPNPALQGENHLHSLLSNHNGLIIFYDVVYRFRTFRPGGMVGPSSLPHADTIHLKANRPSGSLQKKKKNAERAMTCKEKRKPFSHHLEETQKRERRNKLLGKNPAESTLTKP